MTLPLERARSPKPVTWLTILGVLLLPVIVGGILVAALYNPTERLDQLNAAIVNDDEPVEINGQTVPLGRQLSAGLVEGSDDLESNLTWTISNEDDAAEGLADGTYAAVVTIPSNFSAAATSTQPGETPEQATIEVTTPPDSRVVDDAITAQVTTTAASLVGQQLSETYLENVFLGFTTLGEQLGEAADGADQLADGAGQLADGASQAADGAAALPGGISELGSGASQLATGATGLSQGASRPRAGWCRSAAASAGQPTERGRSRGVCGAAPTSWSGTGWCRRRCRASRRPPPTTPRRPLSRSAASRSASGRSRRRPVGSRRRWAGWLRRAPPRERPQSSVQSWAAPR
ncbi:YhgE/Pip family protein [Microbacterium sp. ET2]|uniref:YhgE/Pip domain-containing protein n=1 Tax=Microbacterium albipurpureum TaxID=3050384 RepID=UPI00259CA481|nr:YhgE/Pip family protein [Microbacterium sp. ET2 (Ac-2212)]WJL96439.1 YhgE/Pip family protein [Microbacterium sp. ET2 (Ac-2212)]